MNSAEEASQYIRMIMKEKCILIASSADYSVSITTAIVDIRDAENEVVFDYSGAEELDRLIRKSSAVDFTTYIHGTNMIFSSGAVEDAVYDGRPAFKIKFPTAIQKVQRRDFFRASPPLAERPSCVLAYDGELYRATVIDISIGGVRVLIPRAHFKVGDVIEKCRISTPVGIEIETALEIVHVRHKVGSNKEVHYGCEFKDVSTAVESNLQRYVFHLERQEIAKRRGLQE